MISAYRKQNNRLRAEIAAREPALASLPGLRIDTVDRFQGGERQIILVSLVNSNDAAPSARSTPTPAASTSPSRAPGRS